MSDEFDDWGIDAEEFDAVEAAAPRGPWPAGNHNAVIEKVEKLPTKKGGSRLSITFRAEGGDIDGRKHWENFNLWHDNPQVREISMSQLKSLCKALGFTGLPKGGHAAMEGLFVTVNITHKRRPDNGEIEARASFVAPVKSAPAATSRPAAGRGPAEQQPRPAAAGNPRWARKPAEPKRNDDAERVEYDSNGNPIPF